MKGARRAIESKSMSPRHTRAGFRRTTGTVALVAGAAACALLVHAAPAVFQVAAPPAAAPGAPSSPTTIDRSQLLEDLRTLSSDEMQGRRVGTPGGARARAFIVKRFQESGLVPVGGTSFEHAFAAMPEAGGRSPVEGINVVGLLPGSGAADRQIVVSAHYDHLGMRDGVVFNGADDNASGTAALFALAAHFAARGHRHPLLFVAFDGEEAGLLGSRAFVAHPPIDPGAMTVNLNIDMIGREPRGILYVVGVRRWPALRPLIERVAGVAPVTLRMGHETPRSREEDWSADSDHFAFTEAGIPALYFGVEDFAGHHQPTDDYETITADFYVRAVETMAMVVEALDRDEALLTELAAMREGSPARGGR